MVREEHSHPLLLHHPAHRPPYQPGPALLQTLEGHTDSVYSVAMTPDGRRALSGSWDTTLRLWDLETGACLQTLEGHTDEVLSVALTPDGRRALSGSWDNTVRLWDLETGACLAAYQARGKVTGLSGIKTDGQFHFGTRSVGTRSSEIICMQPINFPMEPPLVTPVCLWLWDITSPSGRWDCEVTSSCLWCGQRFSIMEHILEIIRAINREARLGPNDSPCLELPDEAWEEPRLLSECPLCHKPLKLNPFIVDNRERY